MTVDESEDGPGNVKILIYRIGLSTASKFHAANVKVLQIALYNVYARQEPMPKRTGGMRAGTAEMNIKEVQAYISRDPDTDNHRACNNIGQEFLYIYPEHILV